MVDALLISWPLLVESMRLNKSASLKKILKITVPVTGRMMHSVDGELTYQPYGRNPSECNYSVSRAELNKAMMDHAEKAGTKFYFEHELRHADFDQDKLTFITPAGEKNISATKVFGTDGAGSPTRKSLMSFLQKKGLKQDDQMQLLGASYKELLMPSAPGNKYPIEKNALHIWPRGPHMLMALPNLDGSFTMTLYLPDEGEVSFEHLKTKEDVQNLFETYYPDAISLMPEFKEEFFENPTGTLGTVRAIPWIYKDKVALLGDAAHAVVPFFGQGMNCGFEDCFYLFQFLDNEKDWESAFKKYDEFQRPNGNAIADMAIENFTEMKAKVADPKFLLRKKVEHKLENEFPTLYRSRYGMVTYTLIPYSLAQKAGLIQDKILAELCSNIESAEDLDLSLAKKLIEKNFIPFVQEHGLNLERFKL